MNVGEITSSYFGTLSLSYNSTQEKRELVNSVIIRKGEKIPISNSEVFQTAFDNQVGIDATITESKSEETDPKFVETIWAGEMELPEGRPAGKDIEVTYSYDDNNMMHCTFKDVETGKLLEVEINASDNATEKSDEIEKFLVD